MAIDPYANLHGGLNDPLRACVAVDVTGGDVVLDPPCRALTVNGAGNVTFRTVGYASTEQLGDDDVAVTLSVGQVYPFRIQTIRQTGTAATGIVAWW